MLKLAQLSPSIFGIPPEEQERDVLQERKESISDYLNLFLSISIYLYLSESITPETTLKRTNTLETPLILP